MRNLARDQAAARRITRRVDSSVLRVLSLGAGVQSTTLALMAACGEIDVPDCAIFADTRWEPRAVYDHLRWLTSPGVLPFPVHIVSAGSIRDSVRTHLNTAGKSFASIPWHTINSDGTHGIGQRQCSAEYKLIPIAAKIRELLGKRPGERIAKDAAEVWIGISVDEAQRMKPSRWRFMLNRWPLIERGISRQDCERWLARHGYQSAPKSACIGCPFHGRHNAYWRHLRDEVPDEWADAVAADRELREGPYLEHDTTCFMHPDRVPLDQVDLSREVPQDSRLLLFGEECSGICGI